MSNNLNQLIARVHEICGAWGMYEEGQSSELKQLLYAAGEAGELAISIAKNDIEGIKDGIGDTLVCLINAAKLGEFDMRQDRQPSTRDPVQNLSFILSDISYLISRMYFGKDYEMVANRLNDLAYHYNLTIEECLQQAINEISKRTGKFVNGVFVKDRK